MTNRNYIIPHNSATKIVSSENKVKTYNPFTDENNLELDYLVTQSWANARIFPELSDEAMNKFLNNVFKVIADLSPF